MRHLMITTAILAVTSSASFGATYLSAAPEDAKASALIGESVYGSAAKDAEVIGEVEELLLSEAGNLDAVVIGVGGFLGVGEKDVAVGFKDLKWATDANGNRFLVLTTSKDELNQAPAFQYTEVAVVDGDATATDPVVATKPMTTPNPSAAKMDRATLQVTEATAISAEDLTGTTVYDSADNNVGEVNDVILSKDGKIDAVIIDVGGFLGMGEKPVALAFDDLEFRRDADGALYVYSKVTEAQLSAAPQYVKNDYEAQRDAMRLRSNTL